MTVHRSTKRPYRVGHLIVMDDGVLWSKPMAVQVGGTSTSSFPVMSTGRVQHWPSVNSRADLTPAQLRVLHEVAKGESFQVVADRLGIHVQTVKNHVHDARERNGATSTNDLLIKMGWLRVPK